VKETTRKEFAAASALVVFIGCWVLSGIGPLSWLGALAPFFLAVLFWRRSKGWALAFGLANPLVLTALFAASSYIRGKATLNFVGLPGPQSFNLDRETRLPRMGGGCIVDGSEWIGTSWHNLVVRSCVATFGPMPGTPSGPYPEEAVLAGPWSDAETVELADFEKGEFPVGARTRTVPQAARLLEAYAPWAGRSLGIAPDSTDGEDEFAVQLHAKDFGGGSFAVRITTRYAGPVVETTVLFAGEPVRLVGYFWPKEARSRQQRIPSVRPGT
jgi:hypothetical protein